MVQLDQVTIIYIHFFLCKYTYNSNSILKTRKPLIYMQILFSFKFKLDQFITSKNLRYCINEVDFLIFVQNNFFTNLYLSNFYTFIPL